MGLVWSGLGNLDRFGSGMSYPFKIKKMNWYVPLVTHWVNDVSSEFIRVSRAMYDPEAT